MANSAAKPDTNSQDGKSSFTSPRRESRDSAEKRSEQKQEARAFETSAIAKANEVNSTSQEGGVRLE